jgi:phage gp36-like protein
LARTPNVNAIGQTQQALMAWKSKPDDPKLFDACSKALEKSPTMRRALQCEVAQYLLSQGQADEAKKMAQSTIDELRAVAPFYAEFSEISLQIMQKQYQEALERSVALKEKMDGSQALDCQNLLRIAFLQKKLRNAPGEMAAWRDYLAWAESHPTNRVLGNSNVSLQDYIDERIRH